MRKQEKLADAVQLYVGGPLYLVLSAALAAVMAVGFGVITAIQWLTRH